MDLKERALDSEFRMLGDNLGSNLSPAADLLWDLDRN